MALRPRSTNSAARVASASRSAGVRRSVRSNIASVSGSGSPSATRISKPAARTRRSAKSVEGDAHPRLDPSYRRLRHAGAPSQLCLRQPRPPAGFADELRNSHDTSIADWLRHAGSRHPHRLYWSDARPPASPDHPGTDHPDAGAALGAPGTPAHGRPPGRDRGVLRKVLRRARLPAVLPALGCPGRPRRRGGERHRLDGALRARRTGAGAGAVPPGHRRPHAAVHRGAHRRVPAGARRHVLQGVPDQLRLRAQRRGLPRPVPAGAGRAVGPDLPGAHAPLRRLLHGRGPRRRQLRSRAPPDPQRDDRQPRPGPAQDHPHRLGRATPSSARAASRRSAGTARGRTTSITSPSTRT